MISKNELLECSIKNFTKFGSKRFTMDELASELSISKKTIYNCFDSKEELVAESLIFLTKTIRKDIEDAHVKYKDPLEKIIVIYKIGFDYHFEWFKPSFLFGLKKYYPKADAIFEAFRKDIIKEKVYNLLCEAQDKNYIKATVNLKLVCDLYFFHTESIIYKMNTSIDSYSKKELLDHLIIYNLRGISTANYSNSFFE